MNDIAVIHTRKEQLILVDSDRFQELNKFKWHIDSVGYPSGGALTAKGRRPVRMHKFLCDAKEVDHRTGFKWVNTSWNLRPATDTQNNANRKKKPGTRSQYKGVVWNESGHSWASKIQVNRKQIHLGNYDCERDAAIAYNCAALLHFGEFALPNKV